MLRLRLPPNATHPPTRAEWRAWLEVHRARPDGVWFVSGKKSSGPCRAPGYEGAVEEALCFGWVDSKGQSLDDQRTTLWFAPRSGGSGWSKPNKQRIERLIASGAMHAAGLAKVEPAKRDGSWGALDAVEALRLPPDLQQALAAWPRAAANVDAFARSAKRSILEWIATAKKPGTRAARIAQTARLAEDNVRANPGPPNEARR